jgi:flagellar protein FliS
MDNASEQYLRDAVMTASPEQLQLMLYDGAIRFTRQGIEGLKTRNWEEVFDGFSRAQNIMLEMLGSLNYEVDRSLCTKMAGLYNFVYRRLVDANVRRELPLAQEALRLLEYQRETWVMLLDKLRRERTTPAVAAAVSKASVPTDEVYGSLSVQG